MGEHDTPATQADIQAIHARLDKGSERMGLIEDELKANTQVTTEVRNILETFKSGIRIAGWVGTAARWIRNVLLAVLAAVGLYHAVRHGGEPPIK